MAHTFRLNIEVELERDSGLFASREEMIEAIIEAIEGADPGSIDGLGANGDSSYSVTGWQVGEA